MAGTEWATRVHAVRWVGDAATGHLELLDQRALPARQIYLTLRTADATAQAIRDMVVRGAPAIGLTAAYGVVLAAQELGREVTAGGLEPAFSVLRAARPTAVNLMWALDRMRVAVHHATAGLAPLPALLAAAHAIHEQDLESNIAMGAAGAACIPAGARVLTICNTGSLATAGYGTALGVVRSAFAAGRLEMVYACETRPYLQGARLTMWELMEDGIPCTLITDGMVGHLLQQGMVDVVIAGADRIAANGDTANKIGTYGLAVLAHYHHVPFYIAAPLATIDPQTPSGDGIPIEQRSADEVVMVQGTAIAPAGAMAWHPAFDVTPAALIAGLVTEAGVLRPPYRTSIAQALGVAG